MRFCSRFSSLYESQRAANPLAVEGLPVSRCSFLVRKADFHPKGREGKWISIGGDVTLLPLTSTFVDALVLACSLSLAILWQGELRRLMELLGTGRLAILLGNPQSKLRATASTVAQLTDAAGRLSKSRRGALMVVDLGSDLRPRIS